MSRSPGAPTGNWPSAEQDDHDWPSPGRSPAREGSPAWARSGRELRRSTPFGGVPAAVDGAVDLAGDPSQILPRDVRRQADHALHVVAVVLAGHGPGPTVATSRSKSGAPPDAGRGSSRPRPASPCPGRGSRPAPGSRCRSWVGPVVGHDEPAGRRGRDHRARDLGHRDAAHPGFLAVDLDPHGRIIERLNELEVAERRELPPARSGSSRRKPGSRRDWRR